MTDTDDDIVLEKKAKTQGDDLPPYTVVVLNDDYTPMDFVIETLCDVFNMSTREALETTLRIHYEGEAACGRFNHDIAEMKAHRIVTMARAQEHPLLALHRKL